MSGSYLRKFTLVLLGQIVFCLVAAPILAAERWAAPVVAQTQVPGKPAPDSRPVIQAAFDANDVRPEEVSDNGEKREKSRSRAGKSLAERSARATESYVTHSSFSGAPAGNSYFERAFDSTWISPAMSLVSFDYVAIEQSPRLPMRAFISSLQPTGPPIR